MIAALGSLSALLDLVQGFAELDAQLLHRGRVVVAGRWLNVSHPAVTVAVIIVIRM